MCNHWRDMLFKFSFKSEFYFRFHICLRLFFPFLLFSLFFFVSLGVVQYFRDIIILYAKCLFRSRPAHKHLFISTCMSDKRLMRFVHHHRDGSQIIPCGGVGGSFTVFYRLHIRKRNDICGGDLFNEDLKWYCMV